MIDFKINLWRNNELYDIHDEGELYPLFLFKRNLVGKLEKRNLGPGDYLMVKDGNENAISSIQLFTHECGMKDHFLGVDENKYWCYLECTANCLYRGITLYQNLSTNFWNLLDSEN